MHAAQDSFVGRAAELDRLRALLDGARAGRSRTLVVTGPPGQGKTALLDRLCAEASGFLVVRATGVDGEAELPFATLDAALRPLLGRLGELPGAQRRALEGALALSDGGAVEPFAVGAGTLSLLAAAAEERPLLCVVDDLQWVDDASRRALLFAARRLDREAIAVVFALRPDELGDAELRGLEQLPLPPLSGEESGRVLGDLSAGRLPGETAAQLIAAAGGNPLALHELAARLTPGQLAGREALVGPPPPSAGARELLAERLAALPERSARAVLAVTACEDADTGVLRRVLEAAGLELDDLVPAEERGLLQLHAGSVELRHPLVRSVAYHDASPEARRRAHAAVAAALESGDARRPWHLAAAATAPDADVAAALDAQAARMRLRGGHAAAGRARARAADMTPEPDGRFARLLDASGEFEFAGLYEESARMLERARALADDPVSVARIDGVEASLVLRRGRPRDARGALVEQARALADGAPGSSARFSLQAAFASMALGEVEPWEEHARAGLARVPDDDPRTRDVARAMLAAALIADTRAGEADPLLEQLRARLWDGAGDPIAGAVEVHALLARSLIWLERWDDAERILARLERDARRLGTIAGLPYVLNVRAILDGQRGRWKAAEAAVAEQIALSDEIGDELFSRAGSGLRAWIAALRGAPDECAAAARAALDGAEEPTLTVAVWAHHALALLALGQGEIDRALAELERVEERPGYPEPGSRTWEPDLIEALIRAGRTEEAERRLAAWQAAGERAGRSFALATAARCRGLLAPDDEIEAAFARALAHHESLPVPFQHARTLLSFGERLRRARRRADARAPLREALAAFERLGAGAWAARARTELRATGGMVPAAAERPELEELTPHEMQVALLVAEGKTNREVAAALFLAPKTIEHHLSTIYRKLDVKRRTELARLFAGELAGR